MRALHCELVGRADKRQVGEFGNLRGRRLGKTGRRVETGSHRCAAERQSVNASERGLDPFKVICQHPHVPGPFLAQRERSGILHVRAPDLDDVLPRLRFVIDSVAQSCRRRNQSLLHVDGGRNVHGRWKRIV
jgi:hypothetical protein